MVTYQKFKWDSRHFLKSESIMGDKKIYYKLSNFDSVNGVIGHECINEIIVDRLLTTLGVEHLNYELIHADIEIEGRIYNTFYVLPRISKAWREQDCIG